MEFLSTNLGTKSGAEEGEQPTEPLIGTSTGVEEGEQSTEPLTGASTGFEEVEQSTEPLTGASTGFEEGEQSTEPLTGASTGVEEREQSTEPMFDIDICPFPIFGFDGRLVDGVAPGPDTSAGESSGTGVVMNFAAKRKRDPDDMVAINASDPAELTDCFNTFGGVWTTDMWVQALKNPQVTPKQAKDMCDILRTKGLTPQQVAINLFETFPQSIRLQDFPYHTLKIRSRYQST
jgi:hypothetical protein